MNAEGSNSEAETQVQDSGAPPTQVTQAPKEHFFDRFGKGSIAAMAAVAGLVVGVGGSAVLGDDHDGHWRHRGDHFGMDRGDMRGGWGGGQGGRGQGGPPPMRYRQGGPQGGAAPGARQQAPPPQQVPQTQQKGTNKNGSYVAPQADGSTSTY